MTVVAPGIDRGWDRRDAPRDPGRPEPETTPRDARRAALVDGLPDAFAAAEAVAMEEGDGKLIARLPLDQALPRALRAQVSGFARAMAGEEAPVRRRPSDAGREP